MSPSDRVALILGQAIIRVEALRAENEELRARLAEQEQKKDEEDEKAAEA